MGRMESPQQDDHQKTISFRAPASTVKAFDEVVDNRSEYLREQVEMVAEASNEQLVTPTNEKLRTSYLALVEVQNQDGIVPIEVAKSVIAQKTGLPKNIITRTVIRRLDEKDFADVQHGAPGKGSKGVIRVREYHTTR